MRPSIPVRLLATQSDDRLVELATQGHERAFEALVLRYQGALLRYCRRLLPSGGPAEDALQQGLLQAWIALEAGAVVRDPKPWLYRIVHNAALNMQRSARDTHGEVPETLHCTDTPEDALQRGIALRNVFTGLAALPENQREALVRTAVQGHSHDQVAGALGLSDKAVRGLIYRARATMRTAVTALTPSPLINWVLSSGAGSGPPTAAIAELSAGGGSIGLGGLLLKGGMVVASAGALVGGIVPVSPHGTNASRSSPKHASATVVASQPAPPTHIVPAPAASSLQREATATTPVRASDRTGDSGSGSDSADRHGRGDAKETSTVDSGGRGDGAGSANGRGGDSNDSANNSGDRGSGSRGSGGGSFGVLTNSGDGGSGSPGSDGRTNNPPVPGVDAAATARSSDASVSRGSSDGGGGDGQSTDGSQGDGGSGTGSDSSHSGRG